MKIPKALAGCAALVMGIAGAAGAYTIDYTQLTVGEHSVTNATDGWTATANPSVFYVNEKARMGYKGTGVQGGRQAGEIDINESITFQFNTPQIIKDFTLVLLFAKGTLSPSWDPNEIASITANSGELPFLLTATGPSTAIWTNQGFNTLLGAKPTVVGSVGEWKVTNPFGDFAVTSLEFTALHSIGGGSVGAWTDDSEYAFNSLNTALPVPEPVTLFYLGVGAAGLVLVRRRMKK